MKLVKNTLLPMAGIVILLYIGQYIYMVDGQIDWMRLMLVVGVPFGIPYMLFVIPIGGDPADQCVPYYAEYPDRSTVWLCDRSIRCDPGCSIWDRLDHRYDNQSGKEDTSA